MYKRYEEYKDSGIEWIGYIPEHWEMVTLKRRLKVVNGGTPKSEESTFWDDGNIIWVTPDDLSRNQEKYIYDSKRKITDKGLKNSSASLVPPNSLVVSTRAPIGYVKITGDKISTNQGCKSLIKRNSDIDEVYYYYSLLFKKDYLNVMGQGTTFTELSNYNLANCPASLPPYNEQKAISTYLERVDSEIDSLIADKEALIKKLEEYKQSIITEAVTKGLNPDAKMKDSGVKWVGEIPEHWEIKRLKDFSSIDRGTADKAIKEDEIKVYLVQYTNVYYKSVQRATDGDYLPITMAVNEFKNSKVLKGDILLTASSETPDDIGRSTVIYDELANHGFGSDILRIRIPENIMVLNYKKYLIENQIYLHKLNSLCRGVTRFRFGMNDFKVIRYLIPPIHEQKEIADYLDKLVFEVDAIIEATNNQISLLNNFRQSLIYEAVTGKIDVRDYQPERSEQLA